MRAKISKPDSKTELQRFVESPDNMRRFQQERATLEVTELICKIMVEEGISRSDLAKRLGKTKGYITQLLDGQTNMTIRTMSDVLFCLDRSLHVRDGAIGETVRQSRPLQIVTTDQHINLGAQQRWPFQSNLNTAWNGSSEDCLKSTGVAA